ncbi:MAG TPA: hypothetical protein VEY87_05600 [Gaiellaceae bacterium]|nr:hypothetical protein [Gaiellaceae bacterium]
MRPPSGASAPTTSLIPGGAAIHLQPLAREICRRFYIRFPDELERSAEPGTAWCQHDNQYLLAWAIQEARDGTISFVEQSLWLARVLHSRGFPLEQLTENLLIASDLARNHGELGRLAQSTADVLAAGADAVRELAGSSDFAAPDRASSGRSPKSSS